MRSWPILSGRDIGDDVMSKLSNNGGCTAEHCRGVMVTGNDNGSNAQRVKSCKSCVVQLFALCGRVYYIKDVATDDNGINCVVLYSSKEMFQKALMVCVSLLVHQLFTEVPVGGVEDAVGPGGFRGSLWFKCVHLYLISNASARL